MKVSIKKTVFALSFQLLSFYNGITLSAQNLL